MLTTADFLPVGDVIFSAFCDCYQPIASLFLNLYTEEITRGFFLLPKDLKEKQNQGRTLQ